MTYLIAVVLFFGGFLTGKYFKNNGPLFRRIVPEAATWSEIVYALRLVSVFQICLGMTASWDIWQIGIGGLVFISTFRGIRLGPQSITKQQLINMTRMRALSGIVIYGGVIALSQVL